MQPASTAGSQPPSSSTNPHPHRLIRRRDALLVADPQNQSGPIYPPSAPNAVPVQQISYAQHALAKPHVVPGEYEVAHVTDVIHLNTVETVNNIGNHAQHMNGGGGGGGFISSGSSAHASTITQTSSYWKGNLFLTNYALSFVITGDGVNATSTGLSNPNLDPMNRPLLHVPVGSVWKMDYAKYTQSKKEAQAASKDDKNSSTKDNNNNSNNSNTSQSNSSNTSGADYSGFGSSNSSNNLNNLAGGGTGGSALNLNNNSNTNDDLRDITFQLTLYCRDARVLSFGILRKATSTSSINSSLLVGSSSSTPQAIEDRASGAAEFMRLLKKYAFPREQKKLFAYTYMGGGSATPRGVNPDVARGVVDGWTIYDVQREYLRMGIGSHPSDPSLGVSLVHPRRRARWRLDAVTNARFEFIPTYPSAFWLPIDITDKELGKVKSFRSKGRLPVLVYNYSDLLDYTSLGLNPLLYPDTVILRSAQPNVGWTFGRCTSDEKLLELAEVRVIIDARPYANAVANQAKGGGYENSENYKDCKIEFMCIENIHVMRDALTKLLDTLKGNTANTYNTGTTTHTGDEFWGSIQQSGWLKHVRILLEGALVCANYIKNGISILIHCSDGWDRTSQLTSLAQLILDPFYRTRHGFAILIEKEWISFGHQFQKRCGHGEKSESHADERSPIFFQFLDACWQLQQQFPFSFEFNSEYLSSVADHLYSNKFGTFLGDNDRIRSIEKVRECTQSLWSELNADSRKKLYKNSLYGKGGIAAVGNNGENIRLRNGELIHSSIPPNNPSMNLSALSGSDLGRAAFLHVSADPRKIAIWPYWHRWERRKHHFHQSILNIHDNNNVIPSQISHLHHSPLAQLIAYTRTALRHEKSRSRQKEHLLLDTLASLEADIQRMDHAMRVQATEMNVLRQQVQAQPIPVLTTYRHSQPWKNDVLLVTSNSGSNLSSSSSSNLAASSLSPTANSNSLPPATPSLSNSQSYSTTGSTRTGPPPVPAGHGLHRTDSSQRSRRNSFNGPSSTNAGVGPAAFLTRAGGAFLPFSDSDSDDDYGTGTGTSGYDGIDGEMMTVSGGRDLAWNGHPIADGTRSSIGMTMNPLLGLDGDGDGEKRDVSQSVATRKPGVGGGAQNASSPTAATRGVPPPPPSQQLQSGSYPAASSLSSTPSNNSNLYSALLANAPLNTTTGTTSSLAPLPRHRCLYAFTATANGQVSMAKGEIVEVHEKGMLGWWRVTNASGVSGMAPANRIEQTAQPELSVNPAASTNTTAQQSAISPSHHHHTASAPPNMVIQQGLRAPPSTTATPAATPPSHHPSPLENAASPLSEPPPTGSILMPPNGVPQFRLQTSEIGNIKLKSSGVMKRASMQRDKPTNTNGTIGPAGSGESSSAGAPASANSGPPNLTKRSSQSKTASASLLSSALAAGEGGARSPPPLPNASNNTSNTAPSTTTTSPTQLGSGNFSAANTGRAFPIPAKSRYVPPASKSPPPFASVLTGNAPTHQPSAGTSTPPLTRESSLGSPSGVVPPPISGTPPIPLALSPSATPPPLPPSHRASLISNSMPGSPVPLPPSLPGPPPPIDGFETEEDSDEDIPLPPPRASVITR